MNWEDAIEESKEELGIIGWVDKNYWEEVVDLAKEKFWRGNEWKEKRDLVIEDSSCIICHGNYNLTAHHISYSHNYQLISVCMGCHSNIHKIQKIYGFVVQAVLLSIVDDNWDRCNGFRSLAEKVIEYLTKNIIKTEKQSKLCIKNTNESQEYSLKFEGKIFKIEDQKRG